MHIAGGVMAVAAIRPFASKEARCSVNDDTLATPPIRPNVYYDGAKYFWPKQNGTFGFMPMDLRSVRSRLKAAGFKPKGEPSSEIDLEVIDIQDEGFVDHCGPLAGHRVGMIESGSKRFLVTDEPELITPEPGSCCHLTAFLKSLLNEGTHGDRQLYLLFGWIQSSHQNLITVRQGGLYRPAPALALVGPKGCGKTLLISLLSRFFGGRTEAGYNWLSGRSNFNSELIGAELIVIDDEAGVSEVRARREMNARIKSSLFSGPVKIHGKHREAFSVRPWWRMVFASNDEPENLSVLPIIDDSLLDKITVIKCSKAVLPMPAETEDERALLWRTLNGEIPAFLHWLINEFEIPETMRDTRTVIQAWQHPEIMSVLTAMAPESSLLQMIDTVLGGEFPFIMDAASIEKRLRDSKGYEAARLLPYPNSCGTFLGRLATSHPDRVSRHSLSCGVQRWRIQK